MGRSRKALHHSVKSSRGGSIRQSVSDRTSSSARPWNHPEVVNASSSYGVKLNSHKQVHEYENKIEDAGNLESTERFTCRPCGTLNADCKC